MIISYKNTKEDYIEINKFFIKNKLYKLISNDKKNILRLNFTHYCLSYFKYLIPLYFFIIIIYDYIVNDTFNLSFNLSFNLFLIILSISLFSYLFLDNCLAIKLNNSLNKIIKKSPYILQNKTIEIKDNLFNITYESSDDKNIIIDIKNISKICENEYNFYIFFSDYKNYLIIPYSAFENTDNKKQFIKKIRQIN